MSQAASLGRPVLRAIFAALLIAAPAAAQTGSWSAPFDLGVEAVHMIHLPTGKVLVWGHSSAFNAKLWDSSNGSITDVPAVASMFCSGHASLGDGRIIAAGGILTAAARASLFDPFTETWSVTSPMEYGRYYATLTTLGDGRVLAAGGTGVNAGIPEVYDPDTGLWTDFEPLERNLHFYPRNFVLPDGRVSFFSAVRYLVPAILDLAGGTWTDLPIEALAGGPATMYEPGKALRAGGDRTGVSRATKEAFTIDYTAANPTFQPTGSMQYSRSRNQLVLLPDGAVLATGGKGREEGDVYAAERWDPSGGTWTTLASAAIDRVYHSTATLLADGRVLSAGGTPKERRAEIFSPPYLFAGPRPVIMSAPATALYGSTIEIDTLDAASVAKVTLLRLGAATHTYDQAQRFVSLTFTTGPGTITADAPASGNLAPPGYYMLFLISNTGVPSVASYVRVGAT